MKIHLREHDQPGQLLAVCGFDGSGKTTLEEGLLAAIAPTRTCVPAWAPTDWWRNDPHACRTLFGTGTGQVLPEEALLHFNLADFHALQGNVVLPALAREEVVIGNRWLFDMLALFEARGLTLPAWLPDAAAQIVRPDFCFFLDGPAELIVDRVVRRDGPTPGRFDQDVAFVDRFNASLRQMAETNNLTVLRIEDQPGDILQQCLDVLRGAGWELTADRSDESQLSASPRD